jgi:hypothetical protein
MAKMTGKIVSASTPQQICQYHLKWDIIYYKNYK